MKVILLAIRSLMRFRLYTSINIIGLALSLACIIIICRYVYSETTTDHFNTHHERIGLSVRHWLNEEQAPILFTTENILMRKSHINPLDIPEVEKQTSFVSLSNVVIETDNKKFGAHVLATDSVFLHIFDFPLVEGNRLRVLTNPNGAVITRSFAQKLFGSDNPIGKNLQYNEHLLTIEGVAGETDTQSSLSFDLLISQKLQWRWPPVNYHSAALFVPGTDFSKINDQFREKHFHPDNKSFLFQLLPLDDLYFDKTINKGENTFRQGNRDSLYILSIVAALLLFTGILNFIHISSVVIIKRGRELGMKKVFGAQPRQLFVQLYMENLALTAIALLIGWAITETTTDLQINQLQIPAVTPLLFSLLLSTIILFVLPLIITLYPFFHYSYQHTITSLRGIIPGKHRMNIRSLFLVMQYGITCCLIITSLFFMKQLNFMLDADPGYRTKDIIKAWFQRPSSRMMYTNEDTERIAKNNNHIQDAINASPLFITASFGVSPYEFPLDNYNTVKVRISGGEWQEALYVKVTTNYFNLYEIPVSGTIPVSTEEVLLNATATKLFSEKGGSPQSLEIERYGQITSGIVKGFVPDFQVVHLSRHNLPVILTVEPASDFFPDKLMVSFVSGARQDAIRFLKNLHHEVEGGEFEYSFVEDEIRAMYNKDKQVAIIYSVFALIAILISAMGLFSLSLFDVQQRYREIAIRKMNGATTSVIMNMLLRKYYKLLGIAFLVATPLSWLGITWYLENFAHKAPISWWLFAVALLVTGCISLLTLIWQIRKAARMNPVEAIKQE